MVLLSIYENNVRVKYPFCYFLSYQSDPSRDSKATEKKTSRSSLLFPGQY